MIAYASRTGTRRNLAALRRAGWRLMVSARGVLRSEGFPYALDNGAWTAFVKGEPFDADAFRRALDLLGAGADWAVLPDIVEGGLRSLEFSMSWRAQLGDPCPWLLAVQDGMEVADVRPLVGARLGIFVGGSTAWKVATAGTWGQLAHDAGCWLHVGRVNSARRIRVCAAAGADSFDGSSVSRYAETLPLLDAARRLPDLLAPAAMRRACAILAAPAVLPA